MREISFWKALLCTAKPLVPDSLPLNNLLPPESLSTLRLSPKESSKHYFKKTKQVDKDSEVTLAVGDTKGSKHNFERRTKLVFGSDANALLCQLSDSSLSNKQNGDSNMSFNPHQHQRTYDVQTHFIDRDNAIEQKEQVLRQKVGMKEQGRDKGKVYPELTLSLKDAPKKSPKGQIKNVNVPRTVSTRNMERRSSLVQSSPKQAKTLGADRSKLSPEQLMARRQEQVNQMQQLKNRVVFLQDECLIQSLANKEERDRNHRKDIQLANLTDKYYQLLRLYEQNKNGEIEANKLKAEHSRQSARTNLLETEMAALKEQVKDHEMKNAESLKLLQLLNENITKREEKLSGELIEQGQYAKKVAEQLALTARMHEEALETIDRLSKVGQDTQNRIKELEQELIAERNRSAGLRVELSTRIETEQQKVSSSAAIMMRNFELQNTISQLQSVVATAKSQEARVVSKLLEMSDENSRLQMQLLSRQSEINGLQKSISEKDEQIHELTLQDQEKLDEVAAEHRTILDNINLIIKQKIEEAQHYRKTVQSFQLRLRSLEDEINGKDIQIRTITEEKRICASELKRFMAQQIELTNLADNYRRQITYLEKKSSEAEQAMCQIDLKLKGLEQQFTKQRNALETLRNDLRDKDIDIEAKSRDIEQMNQDIDRFNRSAADKDRQIELTSRDIAERICEIAIKDRDLAEKERELVDKSKELSQMIKNLQVSNKELQAKNKELGDSQSKLIKYEKMLQLYKQEISRLKVNKEVQWRELKQIYEGQIEVLEKKMKDLAEAEPKRSIRISRTDTNRSSGIIHQNAKHREDLIYIETDESNRRDGHRVWGGLADNECEENDQRGPECQAQNVQVADE